MLSSNFVRVLIVAFLYVVVTLATPALGKQPSQSPPSSQQVDEFIENGMAQLNVPGAAVALFKDGKITHLKGFGRIDEKGNPVTPQSPFQIASMTKSFTALVILQLADEGRFSIDDPVVQHIPYFRISDRAVSDSITIRQLMNHRSGLSTLDGNRYQRTTYRGGDALELAVRKLTHAHLETPPGKRFHYSNANYAVLADLIETIERSPLEVVMEKRIFSEIGMANSYMQVPTKSVEAEAKGHLLWFGIPVEDHFVAGRMMMGAGGVTTSAEDLAKYMIAVSSSDPRIIPAALTESWAKKRRGYEFGWEFDTDNERRVIFHNGANPGFRSVMVYTPENGSGGLFLMNMSGTLEGDLPNGTMRYALGLTPVSIKPSTLFASLLWGSLALLVILTFACLYAISKLRKSVSKPWNRSKTARWVFIAVPSLGLVAFAFSMLFYVPRSFGVDFAAASLFNPDLGVLLLALAAISIVWSVVRTTFLIQRCRRF